MPIYYEDSPLASALGFAANYFQGRQDAKQAQLEAQRQSQEDAYQHQMQLMQMQRMANEDQASQEAEKDKLRARGIDPDTGQPFAVPGSLQHIVNNNKGKQPTPMQYAQHAYLLGKWYATQGDKDAQQFYENQGNQYMGLVKQAITDAHADAARKQAFANAIQLRSIPTYAQQNLTPYQQQELALSGQRLNLEEERLTRLEQGGGTVGSVAKKYLAASNAASGAGQKYQTIETQLTNPTVNQLGVEQKPAEVDAATFAKVKQAEAMLNNDNDPQRTVRDQLSHQPWVNPGARKLLMQYAEWLASNKYADSLVK